MYQKILVIGGKAEKLHWNFKRINIKSPSRLCNSDFNFNFWNFV